MFLLSFWLAFAMPPSFWSDVLTFASDTASKVAERLMQDFARVQTTVKSDGSVVTTADKWADLTIREAIAARFPDHGMLTEETDQTYPGTEWCWVVDPLDGTNNFARGIPIWGISLGLLYRGTPVFGYLSVPPIRQTFHAYLPHPDLADMPAKGAYMGESPIAPTTDDPSPHHFFSACSRSWSWVGDMPCKRRMLGAAAYDLVSVGFGATIGAVEASPKVWDIAAAWPIVHAAGAVWAPLDGRQVFPLTPGVDYASISTPVLVVSRPDLLDHYRSLIDVPAGRYP